MYSVVLMAAMTTTPVTPDFRKHGGGGCCGEVASCGCAGGHGGKKHRHHGGGGGCCGQMAGCCGQSSCGCCGSAPVQACGCCGGGGMMAPGMMGPGGGSHPAMPAPAPAPGTAPKTMANPNAATIVVNGAKDATITVGGLVSNGSGDTRVLLSPDLDAGETFHYDVTAEVVRDGQTVRLTRAVNVRAGETTELNLDFAAGAVVMK
ncbi:MAG TPA: TIGR03000 domain-containing protein [Gemmataceae bacterium]|nr:TIGR03000 domain-containing protein [Gemmataceae bacterium]